MRRLFIALAVVGALAGCAHQEVGAAPEGALAASVLREDFTALYQGLQRAHYDLYAHISRQEYDRLYRRTLAEIDRPMTPQAAQALFQRFVAAGRVAHARLEFSSAAYGAFREAGGRAFPLQLRIDGARVFVAGNLSGDAEVAAGDEVTVLDGRPIGAWVSQLGRNVSADNDYLAGSLIELDFGQLMWLERGEVESFAVTLRKADGRIVERTLAARARADMRAAAAAAAPTLSIDPTERVARVLPGGVAYLRPGLFMNVASDDAYDTTAFHAFIDAAFAEFLAAGATTLLIDLRDNPGGDNSFSDHMIAWFADRPFRFTSDFRIRVSAEATASNAARLAGAQVDSVSLRLAEAYAGAAPGDIIHFDIALAQPRAGQRFEGRVFALINRRSYSNTVSVAAILQDYELGTILGEPTADLVTTYGAMEHFTLPHTGFQVGFPKALIIRPNGDARVQGVTPDIAIATPIIEGADDPVLQQALRLALAR